MKEIVKKSYFFEEQDVIKIRHQMLEIGIKSMTELAKKMDVSVAYISNVFNGNKKVTNKFLSKLNEIGINI